MELKLRIEDVADTGQGLSRVDGYVHFVSSGLPGDLVLARPIQEKKNYCVCETLELLEPSALRREEYRTVLRSPYGLDLLPLTDEAELELKDKKVRKEISKVLGLALTDAKFNPIIGMDKRYRYRNKAVFPYRYVNGANVCGAFERLSHNIVEEADNLSMPLLFSKINAVLISWVNEAGLRCYDEAAHKGTLRYVTIRENYKGEHLILLTLKEDELPGVEGLVQRLQAEGIQIKGILKTVKEERGNTPYGGGLTLLYGEDRLEDRVGDVRFSLSVNSFFQVSREGCERLYDEVYRLANLTRVRNLWDVYCGVGSIGLYLIAKYRDSQSALKASFGAAEAPRKASPPRDLNASHASLDSESPSSSLPGLWGLESVEEAVNDAFFNACLNGIKGAEFEYGLAEKALERRFRSHRAPDLLIVDPPRKGLERSAVEAIIKAAPERIIYVSCKVSTLARDLNFLVDGGYQIEEVTPVNLFPMTMHVETVALLSKLDVDKHISVKIELDELDLTSAESKATYEQIKEYVLNKFGFKVSTLYIAQTKRKCGIEVKEHYNKSKKENQKVPQCTPEKEEAIMDALKHFKMI